jgi:ABC-type transporter Mla subunit MlaD
MSSIGKIFVVVNLVLSLLVLGAAGALLKRTEVTKEQVTELEGQLSASQSDLDEANSQFAERERVLNAEKQRLQEDKEDLEVLKANAERTSQRLETDNQQLRDDVSKINVKLDTLESSLTGLEQRNQELNALNAQYLNEKRDAEAAQLAAEQAARDVQDQLAELGRQVTELQDQLALARSDADEAAKLLEVAKAGGFDPTTVVAMPRIEATVAEVDDEYGFVILDKGKDDQVQTGYTFEVHRGGNYLGRVKVDQVYANYSTARIEMTAPNARMQRFDRASTYLN